MKPEIGTACLGWALALGLAVAADAAPARRPAFDAPTGLTLQARDAGRYQMLWDPIYRDDLLGYSVWLRRPGEREFTRLSVPVKVGQEVRKIPVVNEARLVLSLGAGRRNVEITVAAEYENGSSGRAPSVFTASASGPAVTATAQAETPAAKEPGGQDGKAVSEPEPSWPQGMDARQRPLLTPFGSFRSEWGLEFGVLRSIREGNDPFGDLLLFGTGIDPNKRVNWKRIDMRTQFSVPLTLRWGLLPGFEAWARTSYQAEDVSVDVYEIDGQSFDFIVPVRVVDGQLVELSNPTSSGLGDSQLGVRVQILPSPSLLVGAHATLPTGRSRFRSYLDWNEGRSFQAGTGEGVVRMHFTALLGQPGLKPGLSLYAGYSPGVAERLRAGFLGFGVDFDHVLSWSDRLEFGGIYSFPWTVMGRDGGLQLGVGLRSIGPSRWTVEGFDVLPFFSKIEQSRINAHTQARFIRDDQIELSVEATQNLPAGFRAGGRLAYVSGVQGDALRLSGQFFY